MTFEAWDPTAKTNTLLKAGRSSTTATVDSAGTSWYRFDLGNVTLDSRFWRGAGGNKLTATVHGRIPGQSPDVSFFKDDTATNQCLQSHYQTGGGIEAWMNCPSTTSVSVDTCTGPFPCQ